MHYARVSPKVTTAWGECISLCCISRVYSTAHICLTLVGRTSRPKALKLWGAESSQSCSIGVDGAQWLIGSVFRLLVSRCLRLHEVIFKSKIQNSVTVLLLSAKLIIKIILFVHLSAVKSAVYGTGFCFRKWCQNCSSLKKILRAAWRGLYEKRVPYSTFTFFPP